MGYLVVLRHGEARKNVEDRHGGQGTPLTGAGREQCEVAASQLRDRGLLPDSIFFGPQVQVEETARIVGQHLGTPTRVASELRPFCLGCLDGLSRNEATERFPAAASRLDAWRAGQLELGDLQLPGADDAFEFFGRGALFLEQRWERNEGTTLVVTSRSVMILLISVCLGRTPHRGGGYREIMIAPCEFCVFESDGAKINYREDLGTCTVSRFSQP